MITQFKDEYRWLINFVPVEVMFEGAWYKSTENAYQAAKSLDPEWRKFCQESTSGQAKRKSKTIMIREDWKKVRVKVMKDLLTQKFNSEPYKTKLLQTGELYIIEGNMWKDKFWGVCLESGEGKNVLGHLIMIIREKLNGG